MALVLRNTKGIPLTWDELDGNFTHLNGLISGKEDAGTAAAAVSAHVAAVDPHSQYTTAAEAESVASSAIASHVAAVDPHSQYTTVGEAAAAAPVQSVFGRTGTVTLGSGDVTGALGFTPENPANKGAAGGYAPLDGAGLVPSVYLPSFVDDVLEYANIASFPVTGESAKIYVALNTGRTYRWSGSAYTEIVASPGTTDNVTEGATNLYFTNARAQSAAWTNPVFSGSYVSFNGTGYIRLDDPNVLRLQMGFGGFKITDPGDGTALVSVATNGATTINGTLSATGAITSSGNIIGASVQVAGTNGISSSVASAFEAYQDSDEITTSAIDRLNNAFRTYRHRASSIAFQIGTAPSIGATTVLTLSSTALTLGSGITSISGGTNPSLNIGTGALTAGSARFSAGGSSTTLASNYTLRFDAGATAANYAGIFFDGSTTYDSFFGRVPTALSGINDGIGYVTYAGGTPTLRTLFSSTGLAVTGALSATGDTNGTFDGFTAQNSSAGASAYTRIKMGSNVGAARVTMLLAGSGVAGGERFTIGTEGNFPMVFKTNGNDVATLDASGVLTTGSNVLTPEQTPNSGAIVVKTASATAASRKGGLVLISTDARAADIGVPITWSSDWSDSNDSAYALASITGRRENATNGNVAGYLSFATTTGAGTLAENMRLDSSGNLLVGTTSGVVGGERVSVDAGSSRGIVLKTSGGGNELLGCWNSATSGDNGFAIFWTEGSPTQRGSITYNRGGGVVAYNTTSDYRAKDIEGPLTNSGEVIDAFRIYTGKMKGATISRPMMIAHEAQAVAPYCVTGEKDAVNDNGDPIYQSMDHQILVPLLIAEAQRLRARAAALEAVVFN